MKNSPLGWWSHAFQCKQWATLSFSGSVHVEFHCDLLYIKIGPLAFRTVSHLPCSASQVPAPSSERTPIPPGAESGSRSGWAKQCGVSSSPLQAPASAYVHAFIFVPFTAPNSIFSRVLRLKGEVLCHGERFTPGTGSPALRSLILEAARVLLLLLLQSAATGRDVHN